MATPAAEEDAAVARVEAAYGQRDVAAIKTELAANLSSARVSSRSFDALFHDAMAPAAAATADVLLLVLEAVRRHADCAEVTSNAWLLTAQLFSKNNALVSTAVENGALELALATLRGPRSGPAAVLAPLTVILGLLGEEHAARAAQLGIVEVRCLDHHVSTTL